MVYQMPIYEDAPDDVKEEMTSKGKESPDGFASDRDYWNWRLANEKRF